MAYEVVMPYHLHMPSYFLETFTEYPYMRCDIRYSNVCRCNCSFNPHTYMRCDRGESREEVRG